MSMHDWISIETITYWLENYGSLTLFVLLALGIIALPVPEETLLTITGVWLSKGLFANPSITVLAAILGSMCGITVSYLLGRNLGHFLLHKYGSWIGITESRLEKAHNWFDKYGKWSLFFGYFIPGVRHFTGISAGITELQYKHFALFAYFGAALWVSTFLSIGYFFGDYWTSLFEVIEDEIEGSVTLFIAALIIIGTLFFSASYLKRKLFDK